MKPEFFFWLSVHLCWLLFCLSAASLGAFSMDYKERLDTKGRKIYVDDNLRDPEGNQYEEVEK